MDVVYKIPLDAVGQDTNAVLSDREILEAMNRLNIDLLPVLKENALRQAESVQASKQIILST